MTDPVSICIPTYRRPDLLKECVQSVFSAQTRPLEIVVSDDAHDPSIADMLATLAAPPGIEIRYLPNLRGKGQAANANNLFQHAAHEWIIYIHDDDFFLPGGIDALVEARDAYGSEIDAVYGRQYVTAADGTVDWDKTAINDRAYCKFEPEGPQRSPLWAALVDQFPATSPMIRRSIARGVGYPTEEQVGRDPVDKAFAIAYASGCHNSFLLIHRYVAAYRLSPVSLARSPRTGEPEEGHLIYEYCCAVSPRTPDEVAARCLMLNRYAGLAIRGYLAERQNKKALQVFRRHFTTMNISFLGRARLIVFFLASLGGLKILKPRAS